MINTRADFNNRKNEINEYFSFLETLNQSNCEIHYSDLYGHKHIKPIAGNLATILKANGFLLLYNLIESTVLKSIRSIFDEIVDDNLVFQNLSENLKRLWFANKQKPLKGLFDVNFNKIQEVMFDVADSIIANQIAQLETSCVNISGNIDAKEIRSIAQKFGFKECANGRHLVTVKTKRNHLAHGDFSFSEIGKDYTVEELISIRNHTYDYLEEFMKNVEEYITTKQYKHVAIAV